LHAEPATQPSEQPPRPGFGGGGGREMLFGRLRETVAELSLTDDQKTKIKDIFDAAKDKLTAMDPQQRQQNFRAEMIDVREKVMGVLTDDQASKLKEKLENGRVPGARFGGGRPGGPASAGQPDQMAQQNNSGTQVGVRTEAMMRRLQSSIEQLQLSVDQKSQVKSIVEDGTTQLTELRTKFQSGDIQADAARTEAQRIFAEMRDSLTGVLSKDQLEKLRDAIQNARDRENSVASSSKPPSDATDMKPDMKPEMKEMKPDAMAPATSKPPVRDNTPAPQPQVATPPRDSGVKLNQVAPDFTLERLDGRNISLESFKNKPLVIEFGSYSSPSFRQRAAKMEDLARQYSTRANFLVIYTKEAHPTGGWEVDRNKDDRVSVVAHSDLNARKAAAKDARQALKITLPIALDSMDDKIAAAYGAGENSAVVIGRDGKVLSKQTWADPYRLRAALDEALKSTTAPVE
jgi:Spy/CpxP family protein refolding chaperone